MPWSNPGPAKQVLIVGQSGDELVYDGAAFLNNPFGNLIAALSGVDGKDQFGNQFWAGLSLAKSLSFSINDLTVDAHGQIKRFVDGLLHPHLEVLGPGNSSPKAALDFTTTQAFLGNDTEDTGVSVNPAGGVSILSKSGTNISIGNSGVTISFGANGTTFAALYLSSVAINFAASARVQTATQNFPAAFNSTPFLLYGANFGSNFDIVVNCQATTSGVQFTCATRNGGAITGSGSVFFGAIGT